MSADTAARLARLRGDSERRLAFRLAFGLGRTVAELEASVGYDEWLDWVAFHALYDLPDGFCVTGQLGALISRVVGGKGEPSTFAPFFAPPPDTPKRSDLGGVFAWLGKNVPHKQRQPE